MIVVLGSALVADGRIADAVELSLAHVRRSRDEPGCISHHVSVDAEEKNRLNFHEEWESLADLHQHFQVEASVNFVGRINEMAVEPPSLKVYEASQVR